MSSGPRTAGEELPDRAQGVARMQRRLRFALVFYVGTAAHE
eukprot:SAG11_NODE_22422_length_406_cov_1.009772_1_plen_40_part_10